MISRQPGGRRNGFSCDGDPRYPFVTKPALMATFTYWREDWSNRAIAAERQAHAELTAKLRENAKLASEEQRAMADATRITLEDCISDLEAELLQMMQKMDIKTIIPPKQPRYLVMHSICCY